MDTRLLAPIAVILTVVFVIFASNLIGFWGVVAAPLVPLAVFLVGNPPRLLAVFWLATIFAPVVEVLFAPALVKLTEQLLGLLLLAVLVGDLMMTRTPPPGLRKVNAILFVLFALIGITAIVNRPPPVIVLFYLMSYTKHLWVFYFTVRYLGVSDARAVFWFMMFTFAVQLPFNAATMLGLNPVPYLTDRSLADSHVGTIGAAHAVGYYMVAAMLVLGAAIRHTGRLRARLAAVGGALVALVQFFFTFAMHAYFLLLGGAAVQHLVFARKSLGRTMRMGLLAAFFLLVLTGLFSIAPFEDLRWQITSPESLSMRWDQLRHGPKWEAHREVFLKGRLYIRYPWLGAGPGNYTSRIALLYGRPLAQLPHLYYVHVAMDPSVSRGGSVISSTRSGYLALFGELGPVGMLVFWSLYVYAAWRIGSFVRQGRYRGFYERVLAESFVPTMAVFLVLNLLGDHVPSLPLNAGLWIWAGVLWNPAEEEDEAEAGEAEAATSGTPPRAATFAPVLRP